MRDNKTAAIILALVMLFAAIMIPGCKLTEESNNEPTDTIAPVVTDQAAENTVEPTEAVINSPWPGNDPSDSESVVIRCRDVEMNMYDFGQAFYSNQYLQYVMYGMMGTDQYCNMIIDDLSTVIYLVNEAKDNGMELTEDELVEIDSLIDEHVEKLIQNYADQVGEDVEDKLEAGRKNFEEDLAEDGLTLESFLRLAKRNLQLQKLAEKYYTGLSEAVRASDDEVQKYIDDKKPTAEAMDIHDFVDAMDSYYEGSGTFPLYIVDDCFSVNHIFLSYETETTENDIVYLTESRKNDEEAVEAKLPQLEDFNAFMEYESEIGDDPGMDEDSPYRQYGYIINPELVNSYFAGFVYAAMNLHDGSWETPIDAGAETTPEPDPELTFFTLKDGEKVVKVCTESGVHYIIVNKEYKRGDVEYEIGDEIWESWRMAASETALNELFEQLSEQWQEKYTIEVDRGTIWAKYVTADEEANG